MRRNTGISSIKAIVFIGAVAFGFLMLASAGLKNYVSSAGGPAVGNIAPQSPFDGKRAFNTLKEVLNFGPRPSGSPGLDDLRGYIRRELKAAGLAVEEHTFQAQTPLGAVPMTNLWGIVKGDKPGVILISNHYETKRFSDIRFVGANDAGSTTAWMLEMARTLGPSRQGRSVWLCFMDGEEAFVNWSKTDSLYGSRAFVNHLREKGLLGQLNAMVNVDMIGDRFLGIRQDRQAPQWLSDAIWKTAQRLSYGNYFLPFASSTEDDHVPFREAGIPAVNVIDFVYGQTEAEHHKNWHTERDSLERLSAGSLQVVGDVLYHALPEIERRLDTLGKGGV